jgi:N-acetylated-alpha-linked acidic dipeptidase
VTVQRVGHNAKIAGFESNLLDLPIDKDDKGEHGVSSDIWARWGLC